MERRHEKEWARMAWEGDHTFQEVFSMTSLAKSVKLLPWCISTGIPLAIWMMHWWPPSNRAKPPQPLLVQLSWRNQLLYGFQPVLLTHLKLCLLPYLFHWIFLLRAPLPWGNHPFSPLQALCRKRGTTPLVGHLALIMAREPGSIPWVWRLGVNTVLHRLMTIHLNY